MFLFFFFLYFLNIVACLGAFLVSYVVSSDFVWSFPLFATLPNLYMSRSFLPVSFNQSPFAILIISALVAFTSLRILSVTEERHYLKWRWLITGKSLVLVSNNSFVDEQAQFERETKGEKDQHAKKTQEMKKKIGKESKRKKMLKQRIYL